MTVFDMAALSAGGTVLRLFLVVLLWAVGIKVGDILIDKVLKRSGKAGRVVLQDNRAGTLGSLLKSALRYIIGGIGLITILDILGVDTKALLGGAAVLGLAVGFAAQNLVRDIINGFFIIYERHYDVGDYVTVAGVSGFVEEIGLRTTKLRDWSGDLHVVPNGLIDKTTNSSVRESRAMVEIEVAYDQDLRKAMNVLQGECDKVAQEIPSVVEGPKVLGISRLGESGAAFLIWAKTKPLEHFAVERELRLRLKEALDREGIRSVPARVVIVRPERQNDVPHRRADN